VADALTRALYDTEAFMRPAFTSAVRALGLSNGSSGLDVGCGVGSLWPVVAEVVGPDVRLTALDPSEGCIQEARARTNSVGLTHPVALHHLDLETYLATAPPATFDWLWSSDVFWPNYFGDVPGVVARCAKLLKPGGTFAVFTGNYYRAVFLPGYPRLESLIALASRRAWGVHLEGDPNYYENALNWLSVAGLENVRLTLHPVAYTGAQLAARADVRRYLEGVVFPDFDRAVTRHGRAVGLSREDVGLWERLSWAASEDYLLRQPGYACYHVALLVSGTLP